MVGRIGSIILRTLGEELSEVTALDASIFYYLHDRYGYPEYKRISEAQILSCFALPSLIPFLQKIRKWYVRKSLARLVEKNFLVCFSESYPVLSSKQVVQERRAIPGWTVYYKLR